MPSKSNYICVKCEWEMTPEKNGIIIEEHIGFDKPYKIWSADLWKCSSCGNEIIVGFGQNSIVEHFQEEDYKKLQEKVEYHIRETKE